MVDLRRKVGPAKILRKVEAARSQGIMPTSAVLTGYSPKTIAEMGARPRHSLDERAIRAHVKGAYGLESTPEHNIARARVLNAVIARPHLAIKRSWLLNNLRSELGTPKEVFTRVVEELTDLGVLSSRDGYLTISTWFRTGTSGPAEHKMAVERRILSHQLGWQRRKQRAWAMQK
jgi:hypothetical protein